MKVREISKSPEAPALTLKQRDLLTALCFGNPQPFKQLDLLFLFGTPYFIQEAASTIVEVLQQNTVNKIMLTGGIPAHLAGFNSGKTEAQQVYDAIPIEYRHDMDFYLEHNSHNTLANVTEGLKLLDFSDYANICFVFPSHGARRGYLTLRKFLPKANIFQYPYDAQYPGTSHSITRENWHIFDDGIKRVWGEYLRIKQYGQRGDIAYDEVRSLVDTINL